MGSLKKLLLKSNKSISTDILDTNNTTTSQFFISCEGGDFLDGKIQRVEQSFREGVRSIQLVHYAPNLLGDLQTWKEEHGGLSKFGRSVVTRMNELGMLIDVAHASAKTVKMVIELSKDPVILSHSILRTLDDHPMSPRAISSDHARMVTENGGIIGMWPSGYSADLNEFVNSTIHMIEAVGIDHVGIGTDMDANFQPVIKDYSEVNLWCQALKKRGLSEKDIQKVGFKNMERILETVLK